MKWISALELEQWADRVGARTTFPELIRDLIIASASDISDVRFPGGDKGQVRGFDGWLEAAGAPPYVPAGQSIWEFGVSSSPAEKFKSDYEKRVEEIKSEQRMKTSFVFATPRSWDNPQKKLADFVREYRDKEDFKDVRYIDGVMLEEWLQRSGAVGARYAREVLGRVPQNGARSTDEFWDEFSRRFRPAINEEVVLAARGAQAEQIVTHMLGKPGSLVFAADGPDEVSAVAVAAIRKAPAASRAYLEARTLIIDTEEAGRGLAVADRYGYVVSPAATKISGMLSSFGPTISGLGFIPPGQKFPRLERPSTREMTEALETVGLDEETASALSIKSGRILTILERHAPAASFTPPDWVADGEALVPALLAGGWDSRHEGDQTILAELAGVADYAQLEPRLRRFLNRQDSPLDREGGIWKLRAPVDAFVNLAGLLGAEHLALLAEVAVRLFSTPPPSITEERFGISKAPFSSHLRDGVAGMLLMLAVLHDEVGLDIGRDPARYVDDLVATLPGLNEDFRVILSLERQLPALMEAAPAPLLLALERMLEGDPDQIASIFEEDTSFGAAGSDLPNLLWALEMMAWDPHYLLRVSRILAKLAAVDPGGRLGNRPINSLREIFVAWSPGTNAPFASRIGVLDAIAEDQPSIGWSLIAQLMPRAHDSKTPTLRPRFRDAGASLRETLTHGIVGETYDAVVDRALAMLGDQLNRWLATLDSFPQFSPERRGQFLDLLRERATHFSGEDRVALRRALRRITERHRRFPEAGWSLPESELAQLDEIGALVDAGDPVDRARALFDEWMPYSTDDYATAEKEISTRRSVAVGRIATERGTEAVLDLARKARLPGLVAAAAAEGIDDETVLIELIDKASCDAALEDFATSVAGALRWSRGEQFDQQFLAIAKEIGWSPLHTAALLVNWPETPRTWKLVASLGSEAEEAFWRRRAPNRFVGTADELATLVTHYLTVRRPGTALEAIHGRENELPWPMLATLLGMRITEINAGGKGSDMDGYYVQELFKKLRQRDDVPRVELANWEYAYFPFLEYHDHDLVLYELMATDPQFFVAILKDVFVEDGANSDKLETTEEERARGSASHRILVAFRRAPGQQADGRVDPTGLENWVDGMLAAATEAKRLNVVYFYIGRALAHSAELDGVWPQHPVADVIERLKSKDLERGLQIERYNMRGVYSKALYEGGTQERELAERYRNWAKQTKGSHVRTRALLTAIADGWEADARRADEEAARDRLRFE